MKRKEESKNNQKEHPEKKASSSKDEEKERKRKGSLTDVSLTSSSNGSIDSDDIGSFGSDSNNTMSSAESLDPNNGENGDDNDNIPNANGNNSPSKTKKKKNKQRKKEKEPSPESDGRDGYRFDDNSAPVGTSPSRLTSVFSSLYNESLSSLQSTSSSNALLNKGIPKEAMLKARVGFGIAATGIYDSSPVMHAARTDQAGASPRADGYTALVGENRINWRTEFDQCVDSELRTYSEINIDWISIMTDRADLEQTIMKATDNKWIRGFLRNIVEGNLHKFWKGLHTIRHVITTHGGKKYRTKEDNRNELFEHFLMQVVSMLVGNDGFNVIMYLLTNETPTNSDKLPCYKVSHKYCMMAEMILYMLPPSQAQSLLATRTHITKRQVTHFTALAGAPCQLEVLLRFGIDTNDVDLQKQCPFHYALIRNNVTMARQLMWHGTDLSAFPDPNIPENECLNFYTARMNALEKTMASWVKALCAGKYTIGKAVTKLHTVRMTLLNDNQSVVGTSTGITGGHMRRVNLVTKDNLKWIPEGAGSNNPVLLMVLPVFYNKEDALMPGEHPHICRAEMIDDLTRNPAGVIPRDPTLTYQPLNKNVDKVLISAFTERHNGCFYGWHLPIDVQLRDADVITLNFSVDTDDLAIEVSRHCHFFIQCFTLPNNLVDKEKSD